MVSAKELFPVSLPVLDSKNWEKWVLRMHEIFGFQGVLKMVQRGIQEEEGSASYKESKKRDYKALFIIHQCVDEMNFWRISSAKSAKVAWEIPRQGHGGAGKGKSNTEKGVSEPQSRETEEKKNVRDLLSEEAEEKFNSKSVEEKTPEIEEDKEPDQRVESLKEEEDKQFSKLGEFSETRVLKNLREEDETPRIRTKPTTKLTIRTTSTRLEVLKEHQDLMILGFNRSKGRFVLASEQRRRSELLRLWWSTVVGGSVMCGGGSEKTYAVVSVNERRWWFQCTATMNEEKGSAKNVPEASTNQWGRNSVAAKLMRDVVGGKISNEAGACVCSIAESVKMKKSHNEDEDPVGLDAVTVARMKTQIKVLGKKLRRRSAKQRVMKKHGRGGMVAFSVGVVREEVAIRLLCEKEKRRTEARSTAPFPAIVGQRLSQVGLA